MIKEYLKIAIKNLKMRSMRSWLTILGIVIGIFLVISLISLSEGLKNSVMGELKMMGGDLIIVMPGEDIMSGLIGGSNLSDNDIVAIERSEGIDTVIVMPWGAEVARYKNEAKTVIFTGTDWSKSLNILKKDMGWHTTVGEFPKPGRRELLIGHLVSKNIFPGIKIGDEVTVKGRRFTVSGILRSLGNQQDDSNIVMDLKDFRSVTGIREGTPVAMAKIIDGYNVNEVVENIKNSVEKTRKRKIGEDAPAFSVISSETASDMVENIMNTIQIAIFAFASIAIIVGGIGITNTMYTSVKERTKEIGILKAIGAKKRNITLIFLFEAGIIGLIGGIGGVTSGIVLSKGIEIILFQVTQAIHLEAHISPMLIIFGLSFSFLIGCFSGYFPAKKAAGLAPVDALRYE
jgi:putative ABC transport system permease protein